MAELAGRTVAAVREFFRCGAGFLVARSSVAMIFSNGALFWRKSVAPLMSARCLDSGLKHVVNMTTWVWRESALMGRIASRPLAAPIWMSSRMASGPGRLARALNTAFGE